MDSGHRGVLLYCLILKSSQLRKDVIVFFVAGPRFCHDEAGEAPLRIFIQHSKRKEMR